MDAVTPGRDGGSDLRRRADLDDRARRTGLDEAPCELRQVRALRWCYSTGGRDADGERGDDCNAHTHVQNHLDTRMCD